MPKLTSNDWDAAGKKWSEQVRAGFDRVREEYNAPAFLEFLDPVKGLSILDIACGEGDFSRRLRAHGAEVVGTDISASMIEMARSFPGSSALDFQVCPPNDPVSPFRPNTYDLITCFMGTMSMASLGEVLASLKTGLTTNGRLAFALKHPCFGSPGAKWEKTEDGVRSLRIVDYFQSGPSSEKIQFQESRRLGDASFPVDRYHRTLSGLLSEFLTAGYSLRKLDEPRPSQQSCDANSHLDRWRKVCPAFLYLEFEVASRR